ncbi:MAG TPA: 5'-3' exonuclease H3TH domain-containing protein, partial [Candidatus Dormibacteraeota bacterium]|nr:5'-3' exonuclease H3TH domain-containing protein [Candidatus Dormibacteraeota bacterium]
MPKLILVDGSSYLYRAFHALPDLRTSRGEPTGAIRGVVAMLRRLVVDGKPDYFAVVFDAPGKTFRDDWYPQYKATRQPMPDPLSAQIAPLHELIRAHGWPLLMVDRVEADDVIGTLVHKAEAEGIESLVSTGDKDLAQLVTPRVTLVNTMSNEKLDEAGVVAKFGVRPQQVLDLLTLTGDAIDNVPGVNKVGPKTAAKWLEQYGSLQGVIEHASEIGGVVGENLRAVVEWLPQAKRLLTVRTDCSLPFAPKDLVIQPVDAAHLRGLYERFEFKQWVNDIETGKGSAALPTGTATAPVARAEPRPRPERRYDTLLDGAAFERWLAAIERSELACFGVHPAGGDPMQAQMVGLSFA